MDVWTIERNDTGRLIIKCNGEAKDVVHTTVRDAVTVAWHRAHARTSWTERPAVLYVDPKLRDI
jgi:hypothetical protein